MNDHWHEQIQRHMSGRSSAEESAALCEALSRDAELRALYLDYMNLEATLGAAAEAGAAAAVGADGPAAGRPARARLAWHGWRWLAPAAACAALAVFGLLSGRRHAAAARPDLGALTTSARTAISRLGNEAPRPFPAWMSPTAPLLAEPGYTF
jgi:hypothetical protein